MTATSEARLADELARMTPAEKSAAVAKLEARTARMRAQRLYRTPLDLAVALDPAIVRVPALELISQEIANAISTPRSRLIITAPPQFGKSTQAAVYGVLWSLIQNPDRRVVCAAYGLDLAQGHSRQVRNLLAQYGTGAVDPTTGQMLPDRLGIRLAKDQRAASSWKLDGVRGGLHACGIGGGLTGKPADLALVDDPVRDAQDADSAIVRAACWDWYQSVLRTRLSPTASIILIMTRWHIDDLAGRLLAEQGDRWSVVNVPALSDPRVPDALGRPAGEWLVSPRGTTPEDWESLRADMGERAWWALAMGQPSPPGGGAFEAAWLDAHRVAEAPKLERVVVAVDPADTGKGDMAGIVVGGSTSAGHSYVLADLSGLLTRAGWARRACLAAVTWNAGAILVEKNLGMSTAIDDAWSVLRRQASALRAHGDVAAAVEALVEAGDEVAANRTQLAELDPLVDRLLARPSVRPARWQEVVSRISKQARAESVTSLFELGRVHLVGRHPEMEFELTTWQPGQKSPNRLDAVVHLVGHLDGAGRSRSSMGSASGASAPRVPTSSTGARRATRGGTSSARLGPTRRR